MALLEADNLAVFYGPVQALRNVTLHINEGEMVALIGANGAGKTTTLRTLSGMLAPRTGSITFADKRIDGQPPFAVVEQGLAHVPEGRELFGAMSVEENLRLGFYSKRHAKDFDRRAERVMDYFPILRERASQAAATLSGGEQQMLVVARALMSEPKMLLVDELSLGLAPKIVAQLFDILRAVNEQGTAVVLVEQFVHMALGNTDRAYVLQKGAVVAEGPSRQLLQDESLISSYLGEADLATH
ncbi:MAG: branched-chain amino acid transport system ATP-binding protein [Actinomycetota bacterium]|jgi:branched-chain amino acid transport system ATP-binding protein|nr:branched-chain amino acid transport system ATP-binding protein [Actinomycetota bacterium]